MHSDLRRLVLNTFEHAALAARRHRLSPPLGAVDLGDLRRTSPVSRYFGFDRGTPIDRYYIEQFLDENKAFIHGRVLEVGDRAYTTRFGGEAITSSDVVQFPPGSKNATIVADLTDAPNIEDASFDCVILTQTLQFAYRMDAMARELARILAPRGTLLCTVPGISQISRYDMDRWGDYWRLTDLSARTLFSNVFSPDAVEVRTYGNVLAAVALLHGLAASELEPSDLNVDDPDYQVVVAVKATKAEA